MADDPVDRLRKSRELDFEEFDGRVREEAEVLRDHLERGTFDNPGTAVGLEYEFYAVDRADGRLRRIPRSLMDHLGFEKELGLHMAEVATCPQPCNGPGLDAVRSEVVAKLVGAREWAESNRIRLVSDGTWTIGPAGNTAEGYLDGATHEEGLTLAINVSNAVRYHGFASMDRPVAGSVDVPGVSLETDNPSPASLTTSIQPHYQVRAATDLPTRFRYAIRVAGPLLALGVNSPFLPAGLYDEDVDRETLLVDGWAESRIPVFEDVMNPPDAPEKVRFPRDVATAAGAVDRIVEDAVIVPASIDTGERFDDQFVHLRHKHGSFWRWVRPVFDGPTESAANVRIEFRPIPAQPTVRDSVAFLAAFAGSMSALPAWDHPVGDLEWETARENFYAAASEGLDADLTWITAEGERTTDPGRCLDDLLEAAVGGLRRRGLSRDRAEWWVGPLRDRANRNRTPASWKRSLVAAGLDEGQTPATAIHQAQRCYLEHQRTTFLDGCFAEWPDPRSRPR